MIIESETRFSMMSKPASRARFAASTCIWMTARMSSSSISQVLARGIASEGAWLGARLIARDSPL